MNLFETLQKTHIELIEFIEKPDLSNDQSSARVENFIEELKKAGTFIADPRQRNQLRTLLRYWGSFIYENTGTFPDTQLLPSNVSEPRTKPQVLLDNNRIRIGIIVLLFLSVTSIWGFWQRGNSRPSIDTVSIFLNDVKVIDIVPVGLIDPEQIGPLRVNEAVIVKIVVTDSKGVTYAGNDLKCRWSIAPIDSENEDITTESCETMYKPSSHYLQQAIIVEIEGLERNFKSIPPITIEIEISN